MQAAGSGGYKFCISVSHATLLKEAIPKATFLTVRCAAARRGITFWRCDSTIETICSPNRVVLKESPNAPPRREQSLWTSTARPKTILNQTVDTIAGVRGANFAGVRHSASAELSGTLVDNRAKAASDSTYTRLCSDIEQELDILNLDCQLCRTMDGARLYSCYKCKSMLGTSKEARDGLKRLAANVASRLGFCWRYTARGILSKAREYTKRALKQAKRARRDGFASIVDHDAKDKVCADSMVLKRCQPGDDAVMGRVVPTAREEPTASLQHSLPAEAVQITTQAGGRTTPVHYWNCEERNCNGEFDDPDIEVAPATIVWTGTTWRSTPKEPSWSLSCSWSWTEWWH